MDQARACVLLIKDPAIDRGGPQGRRIPGQAGLFHARVVFLKTERLTRAGAWTPGPAVHGCTGAEQAHALGVRATAFA